MSRCKLCNTPKSQVLQLRNSNLKMNAVFVKFRNSARFLNIIATNKSEILGNSFKNVSVTDVKCLHQTKLVGFCGVQTLRKDNSNIIRQFSRSSTPSAYIQEKISSLQIKKRPARKKRILDEDETKPPGQYDVVAFATAEEYKLEELVKGLKRQNLYEPKYIDNNLDAIHAIAKYQVGNEPRELFFFREGSVVMWNITELESSNVLTFLRSFEQDSYPEKLWQNEAEFMNYKYLEQGKPSLSQSGEIMIPSNDNLLEKYTFSNAMALSVKLGIWEASLDRYVDTIEFVTEDLKQGRKIKMSQDEVLRKHGELFALRHVINLSSDLLDTPDFYWDRDQLEVLYSQICTYFSISRRTRVMNEKISHCVELIELLSSHLSDKHHVRLEWMIIILIMVEVGFEIIHYVDRFMH